MTRRLVIKLSHGPADPEPVGQALTVGSTALVSGLEVELWLMGDAVELGRPAVIEGMTLPHAPPLAELWDAIAERGSIYACSQCLLRRGMAAADLRGGVTQAGAQAFVAALAGDGSVSVAF